MNRDFDRSTPMFLQISDVIRRDVLNGVLPLGAQVPPVRQIAVAFSANPNTVQRALSLLEEEGLLYTRGTLGRYVTDDGAVIEAARRKAREAAMERCLRELNSLGITDTDIINYIKVKGEGK